MSWLRGFPVLADSQERISKGRERVVESFRLEKTLKISPRN